MLRRWLSMTLLALVPALRVTRGVGSNADTSRWKQGSPAVIEITDQGLHTLRLWPREDGLRLDRILLTIDQGYESTGEGPVESQQN